MSAAWAVFVDACRLVATSCCASVVGAAGKRVDVPLVLAYLLVGLALGPCGLALVPDADALSSHLSLLRSGALGFIGLVSASEFVVADMERPRGAVVVGSVRVLAVCVLVVAPLVYLAGMAGFPWLAQLPSAQRAVAAVVVAVLCSTPGASVVVAVMTELRAAGVFCRTVLQGVVVQSVLAIVVLSVVLSVCSNVLVGGVFAATDLVNVLNQVCAPVVVGFVMAGLLRLAFVPRAVLARSKRLARGSRFRVRMALRVAALCVCACVPWAVDMAINSTGTPLARALAEHGLVIKPDAMLSAIVGGFIITNMTSKYSQFVQALGIAKPAVFLLFFTMTGLTLDVSVLAQSWAMLPLIFVLRCAALCLAFVVQRRSRLPLRLRALVWTGYIGQGGVVVSLAAQLPGKLGQLGSALSTVILGLLVVNTLAGPGLFKMAVKKAKEQEQRTEKHSMVVVGCGVKPLLFARKLVRSGWNVLILDIDAQRLHDARCQHSRIFGQEPPPQQPSSTTTATTTTTKATSSSSPVPDAPQPTTTTTTTTTKTTTTTSPAGSANNPRWDVITRVTPTALRAVGVRKKDSLVCALEDDTDNLRVAKAATALGLTKVLVKVVNPANTTRFLDLQVLVVDMTSALVEFANLSACATATRDFARRPMLIHESLANSLRPMDEHDDDETEDDDDDSAGGAAAASAAAGAADASTPLLPHAAAAAASIKDEEARQEGHSRQEVGVFAVDDEQVGRRVTEADWPLDVCVHAVVRGTRWLPARSDVVLARRDAVVMVGAPHALAQYRARRRSHRSVPQQTHQQMCEVAAAATTTATEDDEP